MCRVSQVGLSEPMTQGRELGNEQENSSTHTADAGCGIRVTGDLYVVLLSPSGHHLFILSFLNTARGLPCPVGRPHNARVDPGCVGRVLGRLTPATKPGRDSGGHHFLSSSYSGSLLCCPRGPLSHSRVRAPLPQRSMSADAPRGSGNEGRAP